MNRIVIVALVIGMSATSLAYSAMSEADCMAFSSHINKKYPQRVDKNTTLSGTGCLPGTPRSVLLYRMNLDLAKTEIQAKKIESVRRTQRNELCSNPQHRALLKELDIRYDYYDRVGIFVAQTNHKIEDCSR